MRECPASSTRDSEHVSHVCERTHLAEVRSQQYELRAGGIAAFSTAHRRATQSHASGSYLVSVSATSPEYKNVRTPWQQHMRCQCRTWPTQRVCRSRTWKPSAVISFNSISFAWEQRDRCQRHRVTNAWEDRVDDTRLSVKVLVNMALKCGLPAARTTRWAENFEPPTFTSTSQSSLPLPKSISTLLANALNPNHRSMELQCNCSRAAVRLTCSPTESPRPCFDLHGSSDQKLSLHCREPAERTPTINTFILGKQTCQISQQRRRHARELSVSS
eukprot:1497358-Rhodomonas_salina.1